MTVAIAKKVGFSLEEIRELSVEQMAILADLSVPQMEREATQADIDNHFR